jgi:hypothetical protein
VQDRLVLVLALREEQPREVRVLALVVMERPVVEPDEPAASAPANSAA